MTFWSLALLLLVFLSKLSMAAFGLPGQIPLVVFQHGLHPYLNILLCFLLGLPLLLSRLRLRQNFEELSKVYRSLLMILIGVLFTQTLLQFFLSDQGHGYYVWAALASSTWIILIFGILLPATLTPRVAVRLLSTWSLIFVSLSLLLWMTMPALSFKGGRFVGVFKHIPYMVTCASVGIVFTLGRLEDERNLWPRVIYIVGILLSFLALILTGTRSALAAALMAVMLWLLRTSTENAGFRFFKYATGLVLVTTALLFGVQITSYAKDIAIGKKALMEREAQNGVASRLEEVERGWEFFQTSPWLGQGLLAKFSGKEGLEVTSYNSFKDPHNIFVSAGVVGGWPFIIWTIFFLALLMVRAGTALLLTDPAMQIFGIYALAQLPILLIYHWHLSLGGMADRFYWLVFGYLALSFKKPGG